MPAPNPESTISLPDSTPSLGAPAAAPDARWAWRSFDCQPNVWRTTLDSAVQTGAGSLTSDIYLVTRQSHDQVKLRDGRLEVKQLLQTDATGLELWRSVLDTAFPVDGGMLGQLCDAWRRPRPEIVPALTSSEHLLSFLAQQATDVRVIPVREWRRPYRLHDCVVERATALVGGWLLDTCSVEHADPAVLLQVLSELHLDHVPNVSFVTELKARLGWP